MRAGLAGLAAATMVVVIAVAGPVRAASTPFVGTWYAIDVDGSQQRLSFSGAESSAFVYVDSRATYCGGAPIRAEGTAAVTATQAELTGLMGCAGEPLADSFSATLTYDATAGTLSDGLLTWSRGRMPEAFLGLWRATDVDGSAMTLSFGGTGLTRDVAYFDAIATSCDPDSSFAATGTGLIGSVPGDGRFIHVWLTGQCEASGATIATNDKYEYEVATNTLRGPLVPEPIGGSDGPGTVIWHR
ncbi:MAG: hypothetical protein HY263_02830 [Chloroflexi bacterium]|nr:hypothetical protein [Chloroflexota bacterium]